MLDFDDVFKEVCQFGRYQQLMVVCLAIPGCIMNAYSAFTIVFIAYTPEHTCTIPDNMSLTGNWTADKCSLQLNSTDGRQNSSDCLYGWTYDHTYFRSTIVTEYNLVCEKAVDVNVMISMLGLSSVIGAIIFAWIQDRYGRKIAFLLCNLCYICGLFTPLCPTLSCFTTLKFISALNGIASWNVCYTWVLEFIGPSKRTLVSTTFCLFYALATSSIGLLAFLCKTWVQLTLATTAPFVFIFSYYWTVSESPRWLLSVGRNEEALAIVEKIAKWEGKTISAQLRDNLLKTTGTAQADAPVTFASKLRQNLLFTELFRRPNLRMKTILITMSNIACAVVYTTIAYNIENLGGNLYATYVIQAAMEVPATLVNLAILNRVGRVNPMVFGMLLTSIACLATAPGEAIMPDWSIVTLAAIGKFGISLSYDVLCQLAAELYPTPLRGVGIGFSSVIGDIGGIIMPYIILSSHSYKMMPMIILGCISAICGISALFLPETVVIPMAETVEEAEIYGIPGIAALKANFQRLNKCPRCHQRNTIRPTTPTDPVQICMAKLT